MAMTREWKRDKHQYASGDSLWIGKIKVGWAGYDGGRPKGDPNKYKAVIELPGINLKADTVYFMTLEDAKARVERAVDTWFKWLEDTK